MNTKINLFLLSFLLATTWVSAKEAKNFGSLKVDELVRVIDGDTFVVTIHGIHPLLGEKMRVRVARIDTPEMTSGDPQILALAHKAKTLATNILTEAHSITLHKMRREKYFRILAEVDVDGKDLATLLLESGLALPYKGGTKPDWSQVVHTQ